MAPFTVLLVGPAPTGDDVHDAFPDSAATLVTADETVAALDALEAEEPNVVVTDQELSDGDWRELHELLTERQPELPVVLYTGDGDEQLAGDAIAAGIDEYVPRSSADAGVDTLVDRALDCARRHHLADDENAPTEALLELKERAMDEAPVGIVVSDPTLADNEMIYLNDAFERITGYSEREMIGQNCRVLQGDETDESAVETMGIAVDDHRPVSTEVINYTKSGTPFWNHVRIKPLFDDSGELEYYVGFQSDVTERKEAELQAERRAEEVRAERRSLQRLLDRIDGLIEEVAGITMTARQRETIEEQTCEAFVNTGDYSAAWIGRRTMTADRMVASASAGCGDIDNIEVQTGTNGAEPIDTALDHDQVVVRPVSELSESSIHRRLAGHEGAVAVVPLSYRDTRYGVLVVYADRVETIDDEERAVLDPLGNVLATGINAVENQRLLEADERLQLEFDITPPEPFFATLAQQADCTLRYKGSVINGDGTLSTSFLAEGADPSAIQDAAADLDAVRETTVVAEYDNKCLVEFALPQDSFVRTVVDHNGSVGSIEVDPGGGEVEIELPQSANPGNVVESLVSKHQGLHLVAQRHCRRTERTSEEFVASLRDDLTDRQLTAIQTAYLRDYFEWSRPVSGDELAESMGVSRSTFHQHLRAAERKLVGAFLEEADVGRPVFGGRA